MTIIMLKRQCKFMEEYSKEWNYIKKGLYESEAEDEKSKTRTEETFKQSLLQKTKGLEKDASNVLFKIITTTPALVKPTGTLHLKPWITKDELDSLLNENNESHQSVSDKQQDLATILHHAADSLPYLGISLDVIFVMGSCKESISHCASFLPLAGAVRRLIEWHHGRVSFVRLDLQLPSIGSKLAECFNCQVLDQLELTFHTQSQWTGKVSVMDKIENKGHIFSGYHMDCEDWNTLLLQKLPPPQTPPLAKKGRNLRTKIAAEPKQAVLGRTIEVLQEIDLRTFPIHFLDSWTLTLSVQNESPKTLINYIQEMEQTGLLARIQIHPDFKEIQTCGQLTNLNTSAWKENYHNITEPDEVHIGNGSHYMYLLLLPHPNKASPSLSSSIMTRVLLSPHEINRNLYDILDNILRSDPCSTDGIMQCRLDCVMCKKLHLIKKEKFEFLLQLHTRSHEILLQENEETDGDKNGVKDTRIGLLESVSQIEEGLFETAFGDGATIKECLADTCRQRKAETYGWVPDSSLDSNKFPEKLSLQAKDSSRKALQSYPSMESLASSSPVSLADLEQKKTSHEFEINDVLNVFKQDGSHVKFLPAPVKLKGRSLCRVESQPDLSTHWPNSQQVRYHDIYYYTNENDMQLEKKYSKIRDRNDFADTCSSFVSPVKKKQRPVPSMPPVRSSPRRATASQYLMTRDKTLNLTPHTQTLTDKLFKQPVSRHSSPRKCVSLTSTPATSTPASDPGSASPKTKRSLNLSQVTPTTTRMSPRKRQTTRNFSDSKDVQSSSPKKNLFSSSSCSSESRKTRPRKTVLSSSIDPPVRRSPRKSSASLFNISQSSAGPSPLSVTRLNHGPSSVRSSYTEDDSNDSITQGTPFSQRNGQGSKAEKMKRSERHKQKLKRIINNVLSEKGVNQANKMYAACSRNLFNVSMVLLKTLTTSRNLTEEMKTVVYSQVTQIINLEVRRCGLSL